MPFGDEKDLTNILDGHRNTPRGAHRPLGRLPNWSLKGTVEKSRIKRANRYLAYQEKRLFDLKRRGEFEKLTIR